MKYISTFCAIILLNLIATPASSEDLGHVLLKELFDQANKSPKITTSEAAALSIKDRQVYWPKIIGGVTARIFTNPKIKYKDGTTILAISAFNKCYRDILGDKKKLVPLLKKSERFLPLMAKDPREMKLPYYLIFDQLFKASCYSQIKKYYM